MHVFICRCDVVVMWGYKWGYKPGTWRAVLVAPPDIRGWSGHIPADGQGNNGHQPEQPSARRE